MRVYVKNFVKILQTKLKYFEQGYLIFFSFFILVLPLSNTTLNVIL